MPSGSSPGLGSARATPFALILPLAVCLGCGPGVGQVKGTVMFKGKAVGSGTVMVVGTTGTPFYGDIAEDGSYTVEGVPVGKAQVAVSSPNPGGARGPGGAERPQKPTGGFSVEGAPPAPASAPAPAPAAPAPEAKKWFPIPTDYGNPKLSGLELTVKPGTNPFDINLTDKPPSANAR